MSLESLPDEELLDRWNTTVEDEARTAILQVLQKKGLFPSSFVDSWENDTGAYRVVSIDVGPDLRSL